MDAATSLAACICVLSAGFGALCWARANYNMGKSARDRAGLRREDAAKTCDYCHRQLYSKWSVGVAVIAPRKWLLSIPPVWRAGKFHLRRPTASNTGRWKSLQRV